MHEIMIMREGRLRLFQVDDNTLAKLRRIRGNLYADDPRLRTVADMPTVTQSQTPEMSPEMQARAEAAFQRYLAEKTPTKPVTQPQPPQPERKTPEELWRHDPALRAEFNNNLNAYLAYCKAVRDGQCKVYGGRS